mgnify:CR=1 FL=1
MKDDVPDTSKQKGSLDLYSDVQLIDELLKRHQVRNMPFVVLRTDERGMTHAKHFNFVAGYGMASWFLDTCRRAWAEDTYDIDDIED